MVAALSAAARLGILIKNVGDIELAARINAFVFDKTGTLTTGKLAVSRLAPLNGATPAELLRVAASAEKYSNHPTAKALAQLAGEAGVPLTEPKDFAETAGRGVSANIDGAKVMVGRAQWLKEQGVTEDFLKAVDLNETEGFSLIFVARNGQCIGWIGLQDQTRAEAREALAELKAIGVRRIAMVSGDRQPVAARVAREIGCEEVMGECLPQNKVDFVRQTKAKGYRVAVIGDGVNDAPALAAGDLGIAMGAAGSEVAIHSATIALMNNDLRRLPVPGAPVAPDARGHQPEFPLWHLLCHWRIGSGRAQIHQPDRRRHLARRRFAAGGLQQRPTGAPRRGTGAASGRRG